MSTENRKRRVRKRAMGQLKQAYNGFVDLFFADTPLMRRLRENAIGPRGKRDGGVYLQEGKSPGSPV